MTVTVESLAADLDTAWLILTGSLVFFMHCGFTMLECGAVRTKNVSNIIFKTTVDVLVAAIGYWCWGWAIAYGGDFASGHTTNGFIGTTEFCITSGGDVPTNTYANWFLQFCFAVTSATIVSGAVAERINVYTYCFFSLVVSTFIYPVVTHWIWSKAGFLSAFNSGPGRIGTNGVIDFAGAGAVHLTGGTAALVAAAVLGPRRGRFGPRGEPLEDKIAREEVFRPHNRVLSSLGTLILWFGWYGFNCGATLALSNGAAQVAGRVAVTTTLGGAGAGLSALLLARLVLGHLDVDSALNGILAGLVSVTAACSVIEPWAAVVAGLIGGLIYFGAAQLVVAVRVDDPLQAAAVHGFCGIWGMMVVGLFASQSHLSSAYGITDPQVYGTFLGGGWEQLGVQMLAVVCIAAWSAVISAVFAIPLKMFGIFRVPAEVEENGLDSSQHGGSVYEATMLGKPVVRKRFHHHRSKDDSADMMPGQDSGYPTYDGIGGDAFDSHPDSNRGVYDAANSEPYADSGLYPEVMMPYSSRGNASNVYYTHSTISPTPNFFYPGDTGHSGYSAPNW
eukprot:CAMPEP_0174282790 /NCGR_PEP_ID=MMETSP0809-20121228/3341_1 /TAXON_ID=73025 ORGANISM="Eutreptiella gymnastica-like, Strain CCMP1594" /NCGR_SAMPLE_ID=MMETSP0809 /ASSEMBLY_ACC=CAM_ASM_000658 /LENGTH=560 /DNA_ID=CAMNT_0015377235 /DNA_START=38 /DNA_END=1717 /DNA_ORIENTATION=-